MPWNAMKKCINMCSFLREDVKQVPLHWGLVRDVPYQYHKETTMLPWIPKLVGGFNPFEKVYSQIGSSHQVGLNIEKN